MEKISLKSVHLDLPEWMVADLDHHAQELGINRKSLINILLASILRKKNMSLEDLGYLKAIEESFSDEWESEADDIAFKDL